MAAKPSSAAVTPTLIRQKLQPLKQSAIEHDEKRIEEVLAYPILLSDQISDSVNYCDSFKFECAEVGKQVDHLCQMLRSAARLATSSPTGCTFYDCPLRRIASEASLNLERSLTLVKKYRRRSILRRVVTTVSAADFRKLLIYLENSVADMKWVLSIFDSWVWSFIASLHTGQVPDKIEAANELASLAGDNDRNKQIIVDEGGIQPLLKLLKDPSSSDAQMAAVNGVGVTAAEEGFAPSNWGKLEDK